MFNKIRNAYNGKLYKTIDVCLAMLAIMAASAAMFVLCYRQAISDGTIHMSDIRPYIDEVLGTQTKYSFPYPVLFKTAGFINLFASAPELAMAVAVTLFNVIALAITKVVIEKQTGAKLLSTGVTLCLFFLSMIYSGAFKALGIENVYTGVFSPNPWHNQTYMAARPFMILAFVFGAICLRDYEKDFEAGSTLSKKDWGKYIAFTISLLLATMAKPSYTLIHMAAAGLVMLYRFFKNVKAGWRPMIGLGCFYIPTIIALLYQYAGVFSGNNSYGEEQGIGFGIFKTWSVYTHNYPLAWILAAAFPFVVLALHFKLLKTDDQFRFAWQVYLAGLIMAVVLYEKGVRMENFNFAWGYICGLFIVFMVSAVVVLKDTMALIMGEKVATAKYICLLVLQWGFLAIHTLMGLRYFALLCYGWDYT